MKLHVTDKRTGLPPTLAELRQEEWAKGYLCHSDVCGMGFALTGKGLKYEIMESSEGSHLIDVDESLYDVETII